MTTPTPGMPATGRRSPTEEGMLMATGVRAGTKVVWRRDGALGIWVEVWGLEFRFEGCGISGFGCMAWSVGFGG